jgi:predicted ABC-type ATPase
MPVLYILAGPNGTGKTTFYSTAVKGGFISPTLPFINVDQIAQSLGGYTEENYVRAPEMYRQKIKELLETKSDFMIESNLAESRDYDWISLMKKNGYSVVLYYLSTVDVEINIGRVKRRVSEGGHDIPESIIRTRFSQSHSYLKTKIREFDEVFLIENSTDLFEVQATVFKGKVAYKSDKAQTWIREALRITELLQSRGNP